MRYELLILSAVCYRVIQAGPVRQREARVQQNIVPRFVNTTYTPSRTTSDAAPSTTSSILIPFSDDDSLGATPPSRVVTSNNGQVDSIGQNKNAQGINVAPEGGAHANSIARESSSATKEPFAQTAAQSTEAAPSTLSILSASQTVTVSNPAISTGENTRTSEAGKQDEAAVPSQVSLQASVSQPATQVEATTSSPRLPNKVNKLTQEEQQADSNMKSETAIQAANVGSSLVGNNNGQPLTAQSTGTQVSGSRSDGDDQAMNAFRSARSSLTTAETTSATSVQPPSASSLSQTAQTTLSSPTATASPMTQTLDLKQAAKVAATTGFASGQVPASLLGDVDSSPSTTSPSAQASPSQSSTQPLPQYNYPDASLGGVEAARQHNDVFQGLKLFSKCDPSNSQQISACVVGQPAKCERDGHYSLISCNQGESCYAVPRQNGKAGVEVGCFQPSYANSLLTTGSAGSPANTGNAQPAQSVASSSRTNAPATSSVAAETSLSGSQDSTDPFAGRTSNDLSSSVPQDAAADNDFSSGSANQVDTKSTQAVFGGFPEPSVITASSEAVLATSSPPHQPSPTLDSTPKQQNPGSNAQQDAAATQSSPASTLAPKQQSQTSKGHQDNGDSKPSPMSSPAPKQQSQSSQDREDGKDQHNGSKDKPNPSDEGSHKGSPKDQDDEDSGVQLSFPGAKGSSKASDDSPSVNQKNAKEDPAPPSLSATPAAPSLQLNNKVVAAPSTPVSSPELPQSPSITPAPQDPGKVKGFITVTVTTTATVHD